MLRLTERFGEYISSFGYEKIPSDTLKKVRMCLLDWIAVTNTGSREPCAKIVWSYLNASGARGNSTARNQEGKMSAADAALFNGTAVHSFDFDDIIISQPGHPGGPVISAALAVAEQEKSSGKEFLTAVALGIHVEQAISSVCVDQLVARGWHSTSIVGVIGAAAAASYLLKLDAAQCAQALGLAATQASGIRAEFGTMGKPLHVGNAAHNGVFSAYLAKNGYTAALDSLEKKDTGYLFAFSGAIPGEQISNALMDPDLATLDDVGFKYYPCCFLNATSIECALAAIDAGADVLKIKELVCTVYPDVVQRVDNPSPRTGLEAKFSVQFCIACALLEGSVTKESFQDDMTQRDDIKALMSKVSLKTIDTAEYISERCGELLVVFEDGSSQTSAVNLSALLRDPQSMEDHLLKKYHDLMGEDAKKAAMIKAIVEKIEDLEDVFALTDYL